MFKNDKTPAPGMVSGVEVSSNAAQDSINHTAKPAKLAEEEIHFLLRQIPENAKQARRLFPALGRNPDSPTNRLNKGSGVNLSLFVAEGEVKNVILGLCRF